MSKFDLNSAIFGVSRSVLDTQEALENTEPKMKTTGHKGCQHCNRLRVLGMPNGYSADSRTETYSNGEPHADDEEKWEKVDVADLATIPENIRSNLSASVSHLSVESHDADSPVLRRVEIPAKYMNRFMSLSLYSGKELGQEIKEIIERLKECEMTEEQIETYLRGREVDIKNGHTSEVYITFEGEKYKTGLQIYTRASRTLRGLRHFIRGTGNTQLAKDLSLQENDMLLMVDSDCVTEWPHKQVVNCLSNALKNKEDIALVIFRDLPGKNNHIYLTVRGQVTILIPRGNEPIEVIAVDSLSQEVVDNKVIGLKKIRELPPIFIWQHELMGKTAQYSMSINDRNRLYMDVTSATNTKAHWVIYLYRGDIKTFENGFLKKDENAESFPHTIWLIRNTDTKQFIAINDGNKQVYLSNKGILPDQNDAMCIDERMMLAHPQHNLKDTFLLESLRMTKHFLCVDSTDYHKVDISDNTQDSYISRFAFQIWCVSDVIGKSGDLPTIRNPNLFGNALRECQPVVCPSHPANRINIHDSFERIDASYLFSEACAPANAIEYSVLRERRNGAGSKKGDEDDESIPSGPIKDRWKPLANATKDEDPAVLRRAGMYKFLPPPESPAEKEGVDVEGRVRNMREVFEFNRAIPRGHVEILSKTFKV